MSPQERRRRWSNIAFTVAFGLLAAMGVWWTVLIHRLAAQNAELEVQLWGATSDVLADLERKRWMLMGEGSFLVLLALVVVGLAWRSARAEREQIRRLEGMLAASTHELKTPVAAVRALLESMQRGVLPPERQGPHVSAGLASLARLEHLIEGILAYQSVLAKPEPRLVALPLEEHVWPALDARAAENPEERLDVELGPAGEVEVLANRDAMRVILDNLLDNAARYGKGGAVHLRARAEGEQVCLDVRDEGEGFATPDRAAIFEPYERGSASRSARGTGLGLFISRTLARGLGGELTAASPGPGQGATFTLCLRRAKGEAGR